MARSMRSVGRTLRWTTWVGVSCPVRASTINRARTRQVVDGPVQGATVATVWPTCAARSAS
eukprot:2392919-Lingulodinium_polyedra.AAC.1